MTSIYNLKPINLFIIESSIYRNMRQVWLIGAEIRNISLALFSDEEFLLEYLDGLCCYFWSFNRNFGFVFYTRKERLDFMITVIKDHRYIVLRGVSYFWRYFAWRRLLDYRLSFWATVLLLERLEITFRFELSLRSHVFKFGFELIKCISLSWFYTVYKLKILFFSFRRTTIGSYLLS